MKRISFIAILLFALGAMYMVSCQKDQETTRPQEPTTSTETVDANGVSERGTCVVSADATCWAGSSCVTGGLTNTKVNRIMINTNGNFIPSYGLTYRFYKLGVLTPFHQFNCTNSTVYYASTALLNNTTYTVRVFNVGSWNTTMVDEKNITMGNFNGQPCFDETK
jgi:hypothetical protein